jgi:hypothetical protein
MNQIAFVLLLLADGPQREFTVPKNPQPEYGHALTAQESRDGWISLFDGKTTYGWDNASISMGKLTNGRSNTFLQSFEFDIDVANEGRLILGEKQIHLSKGRNKKTVRAAKPTVLQLGKGLSIRSLKIKPLGLADVFDGKSLNPSHDSKTGTKYPGWKVIPHPRLPKDRQTKWQVVGGVIHAESGPGALQLNGKYADFVLQIEVKTRADLVNGGVFFRSIADDFMNGYEAQLFNACYDRDPAQPARYSTGAIDDRLLARRLVSRDKTPFVMTVIAHANHIATWVNGYQTASWKDTRDPHENPRQGKRTAAGAIQLQSHDPESNLEFRRIRIGEFGSSRKLGL